MSAQIDFWPELQRRDMVDLAKLTHVPGRAATVPPRAEDGAAAPLGKSIPVWLSADDKTARQIPVQVEVQAKRNLRATYGIDPDLPGWGGLVKFEMKRLDQLQDEAGHA